MFVFHACWGRQMLKCAQCGICAVIGSLGLSNVFMQRQYGMTPSRLMSQASYNAWSTFFHWAMLSVVSDSIQWVTTAFSTSCNIMFSLLSHAVWRGNGFVCLQLKMCGISLGIYPMHVMLMPWNTVCICKRLVMSHVYKMYYALCHHLDVSVGPSPCCYPVVVVRLEWLKDPVSYIGCGLLPSQVQPCRQGKGTPGSILCCF